MIPKKVSNIENIVKDNEELELQQIKYLMYETANRTDYLTLNYIENKIIENYGQNFIPHSKDKIAYLMELLLNDDPYEVLKYYKGIFSEYMKQNNYSFEGITSFNLIFMTHMHLALKIIRSSKN